VADDRVLAWVSANRLFGRAPKTLSGLIEVRGQDVLPVPSLAFAQIALVVDLVASPGAVERIPALSAIELEGVPLRRIALFSLGNSAVAKLTLALQAAPLG
jgi:serine kinase of HPr protein (carbohydrate metabolism regulator)